MALPAPKPLETANLAFNNLRKLKLFPSTQPITDYCQLISSASQHGLVFAGSSSPELKVLLSHRMADKDSCSLIRTVPLPSPATHISVNCDGSLLAVEILNQGTPFISIYSVPSFHTAQPRLLESIRVCPEPNVRTRQLCWNPVMSGVLAVCLTNGALCMYSLKDKGFEFHTLDKSNCVQSICWSPKGKQIVAGQLGFKLVQYKPDLATARTIQCPMVDASWGTSCSVITIQWLSTYQFAVGLLPQGSASPNLLIVNAPKSNQISMVNYYEDLCFSEDQPRPPQLFFVHIHEWNMLLVGSSNSNEIGVLATTETGDAPTWQQYIPDLRMETPLTQRDIPTFPLGLCLDTSAIPVMDADRNMTPRLAIHLLSNHGDLMPYWVLNQLPNMKDVCSPPAPVQDQSGHGQFTGPLNEDPVASPPRETIPKPTFAQENMKPAVTKEQDMTFNFGGVASTPIVPQKTTSIFGGATNPMTSSSGGLFGSQFNNPIATNVQSQQPPITVKPPATEQRPMTTAAFNIPPVATSTFSAPTPPAPLQQPAPTPAPVTKPLISVPPKFTQPTSVVGGANAKPAVTPVDSDEDQKIFTQMMLEDIAEADKEIKTLLSRCRATKVDIGTKEEMQRLMKDLSSLTDFRQQAVESSDQLTAEVRLLNLSLNESFSTTQTANTFLTLYKNPETARPRDYMTQNPANRRNLMRLENALVNNEQQVNFIRKQLLSQWAEHEEVKRQYSKDRMHIPCLEGVYETLTRQKEILFRENQNIGYITSKLSVRLLACGGDDEMVKNESRNLESMAESMLSMTLNETTTLPKTKVNANKLRQLHAYLSTRPVTVVKPARPQNGMNSDVILARKEKLIKERKAPGGQMKPVEKKMGDSNVVKMKAPVVTESLTVNPKPTMVGNQNPSMAGQGKAFAPNLQQNPIGLQKQQQPQAAATKPLSFGGFGDNSFGNKPETKAATSIKENVAPNLNPVTKPLVTEPANTGFGGFGGGLNLTTTSAKKEEPPAVSKPAAPAFSFNIQTTNASKPSPTTITTSEVTTNKPSFGSMSSGTTITPISSGSAQPLTKTTVPSSTTITAIPPAATSTKSFFGGLSSGAPLTFGGSSPTVDQKVPSTINETAVLDSLKICSPAATTASTTQPSGTVDAQKSIFSSNAFSNLLGSTTPTVTPPVTTENKTKTENNQSATTAITSTAPPSIFGGFGGSTSTSPAVASTTASASPFGGFGGGGSIGFGGITTTAASTFTAPVEGTKPAEGGIKSLFGGLSATGTTSSLPKPDQSVFGGATAVAATTTPSNVIPTTVTAAASSVPSTAPSSAAASAFSFTSMSLGTAAPATAVNASPFGAPATAPGAPASAQSIFGGASAAMGATPTPSTGFGGGGGSMFGGSAGAFGSPAAATATVATGGSIFGGGAGASPATAQPATGGSIFGGGAAAQGGTTSVFGGQAPANNSPFGGGGAATAAAPSSGNIFGSPIPSSGGSIFGGGAGGAGAFGGAGAATTGGSIFGGGQQQTASPASSGFSFAGAAAAPAFGSPAVAGSPFGGGAQQQPQGGGFGQQQQSPFGGGGAAPAGSGVFGKPAAFGSPPPAFGSPATFGGPPVFGGGATFGGGFGSPTAAPPVAAQQTNNLFASLGQSESSLSFGNLAQTNAMQQAKPAFGGSAFSSWR